MDVLPLRVRPGLPSGAPFLPAVAALVAALLPPSPLGAQQLVPRFEDAELPSAGVVWLAAGAAFQNWHREFGPGGGEVPLAADFDGPLLEQVYPGPAAVVSTLNADAEALGFSPLSTGEAAVGRLRMRELNVDARALTFSAQVGVLDRLSIDLMVPVVRTEAEPFFAFDPAGATLAGAAAAVSDAGTFFGSIADARTVLQQRIDGGQLSPQVEAEATALLDRSGAFASALQRRVEENALVPTAGSSAGGQIAAFYGQLRSGFQQFGLALPAFSLPSEGDPAFLDDFFLGTLAAERLGASGRGWLAGETEIGVRFGLLRGFRRDRQGLQLRTTVGLRARLPFRGPNTAAFFVPSDLLGVPLGDGQRDLELSLYQDLRLGERLLVNAGARYGLQTSDVLLVRLRSPERPLSLPDQLRLIERDPGDYVQLRFAPRFALNRSLSLGAEYGLWRKASDEYRLPGATGDPGALEAQTEQVRHRLGAGAFYRPGPPEDDGPDGDGPGGDEADGDESGRDARAVASPEVGVVWQTTLSGSGGETPIAGIFTFQVRLAVRMF